MVPYGGGLTMPQRPPSSAAVGQLNIMSIAALLIACVVLFICLAFWSTTQPQYKKQNKEIQAYIDCDTDGVVCR